MRGLNDRTDPISRALLIQLARHANPGKFEEFIGTITCSIGINHMSEDRTRQAQGIVTVNGYYQALIETEMVYHKHSAGLFNVVSISYNHGPTNIDGRFGIKVEIPESLKQKHLSMMADNSLKLGHILGLEGLDDQPVIEMLSFSDATIYKIKPFKPISWNRSIGLARKQIPKITRNSPDE